MNDKILVLLVWIFMVIFFSSAGLSVIFPSNNWLGIMLIAGFAWGGVGLFWMWSYRYTRRNLNKDSKNPLSWKTRIKRTKVYAVNQDGKRLSLTGKTEVTALTILTWLITEIFCGVELKLNYILSFEVACIAGFLVLGSLIALYFSRRKRRMIERFVPPARITKVGFILAPSLFWLIVILGSSQFTTNGWLVGVPFGGIIAGWFWIRLALRVRKTGWKKFSWSDALKTVSKSTRNYNAMSRWANKVIKSKKVSF